MNRFVVCDYEGCNHIFPEDDLPLGADSDGRCLCSCGDGWIKVDDPFFVHEGIDMGIINEVVLGVERWMRSCEELAHNDCSELNIGARSVIRNAREIFRQAGYPESLLDLMLGD